MRQAPPPLQLALWIAPLVASFGLYRLLLMLDQPGLLENGVPAALLGDAGVCLLLAAACAALARRWPRVAVAALALLTFVVCFVNYADVEFFRLMQVHASPTGLATVPLRTADKGLWQIGGSVRPPWLVLCLVGPPALAGILGRALRANPPGLRTVASAAAAGLLCALAALPLVGDARDPSSSVWYLFGRGAWAGLANAGHSAKADPALRQDAVFETALEVFPPRPGWRAPDPAFPLWRVPDAPPCPVDGEPVQPCVRSPERRAEGAAPKNLLVILVESLQATAVGALTPGGASATPELDALAAQGVLLDRYYESQYLTGPAILNALCGVSGAALSSTAQWQTTHLTCLSDLADRAGLDTFMLHGHAGVYFHRASFLRRRHFDYVNADGFPEDLPRADFGWRGTYNDAELMELGRRRIRESVAADRPFFGVLLSLTSHAPYGVPPAPFWSGDPDSMEDRYHASVRYADHQVGELVRWLRSEGLLDDTLVVISGDHKAVLDRSGWPEGEQALTARGRVPLVLLGAGLPEPPGTVVHTLGSHLDLPATLASLMSIEGPNAFLGRPLFGDPHERQLLVGNQHESVLRAVGDEILAVTRGRKAVHAIQARPGGPTRAEPPPPELDTAWFDRVDELLTWTVHHRRLEPQAADASERPVFWIDPTEDWIYEWVDAEVDVFLSVPAGGACFEVSLGSPMGSIDIHEGKRRLARLTFPRFQEQRAQLFLQALTDREAQVTLRSDRAVVLTPPDQRDSTWHPSQEYAFKLLDLSRVPCPDAP